MTSPAFPAMIERLLLMYGTPDVDDVESYLTEYARQLRNYSVDELSRGTDIILRSRKFKTWPTIGECIHAAEEAREQLREKHPASPTVDKSSWSQQAFAWADNECRCDDGKIAAQDGWIQGLHENLRLNFARDQKRWPTQGELVRIQHNARFVDSCAAGEVSMGDNHDALKRLARSIRDRREKLVQRLFDKQAEG